MSVDPYLHIAEFGGTSTSLPAATLPPIREQRVPIEGKSVQSRVFASQTILIRLYADVACAVLVGEDPDAETSNLPIGAGSEAYFYVPANHRLAVIAR